MDLTGIHWLLGITLGGVGFGFGLALLLGLAAVSYYLSPYYPFMRFLLKRLYRPERARLA